ncbi:MAG: pre-peptidase C-terminal domain-containing protein [Terricaulis sp.]
MRVFTTIAVLLLLATSAAAQTPAAQPAAPPSAQRFTGALTSAAPRVSFPIELQAGQIVTLSTSSTRNLDTILALSGPDGRQVARNDDRQPGVLSSRIVYVVRTSGRHNAVVTGYGGATGAFELAISTGLQVGLSAEAQVLREERVSFDRRRTELRFPIDLKANDIFVASTLALSGNIDSTLQLLDSSGAILSQNDDRGDGSLDSQLVFEAAEAGRYEVLVSTFDGRGVGDLMVSLALDPNAQAPMNFASIRGARIANFDGELSEAQQSRDYPIQLAAGQTLLAISDAVSGDLDTVLRLNDADGYPVALNDDRGDGSLNSGFAFTAPRDGAYILQISRYMQSDSSGTYRLALSSVDASVVNQLQDLLENPVTLSGAEQVVETADFSVHYTTAGGDASTPEYARATADTLQTMLDAQVNRIGWAAPVRDSNGRYRAYIANANGDMGYTKSVQMVFDNPNTANVRERGAARAVLVIENDFANMGKKASPISLMRATATHELNHVIQYGYDADEPLGWLYESTASWAEVATAGADQDATDYVETDFAAPHLCWTTNARVHNYAQWTLLQSLADSYGDAFIVRLWESSVQYDGFETMARALQNVGTTIPDAVQRWRAQNFALDYDLAPRFARAVRLDGAIRGNGRYASRVRIEQLGAGYVALRLQGPRTLELRGDANLEMLALGKRNGQIEIVPLGRRGVFDTTGFDYAALMVFNRAMPVRPGACSSVSYSINVEPTNGAPSNALYRFNAEHFKAPR